MSLVDVFVIFLSKLYVFDLAAITRYYEYSIVAAIFKFRHIFLKSNLTKPKVVDLKDSNIYNVICDSNQFKGCI